MNAGGVIPWHCTKMDEGKITLYCSFFFSFFFFPVKYLYFLELKWKAKHDQRSERLKIMGSNAFFLQALVARMV